MMRAKGFTLIELLIVVAIIAILAAIAVPNFLEAQTRAKVARVKNDLRTQSTALQAYYIDWNKYTRDSDSDLDREVTGVDYNWLANGAVQLTTPVAYMSSLLTDPFTGKNKDVTGGTADGYRIGSGTWSYRTINAGVPDNQGAAGTFQDGAGSVGCFITLSPGPDKKRNRMGYKSFPWKTPVETAVYEDYDPTNGTISGGDILRFGGSFQQGNWDRIAANAGPRGPEAN